MDKGIGAVIKGLVSKTIFKLLITAFLVSNFVAQLVCLSCIAEITLRLNRVKEFLKLKRWILMEFLTI